MQILSNQNANAADGRLSAASVLLAAVLWGCIGLFVRHLNAAGLYALEVVQLRITVGLAFVGLYMLLLRRRSFRVRPRDLWCFAGTGLCSLLFFSYCYFTGMSSCTSSGRLEDRPCRYSSSVPSPHGSTKSWWRGLSGKRSTFVSIEGQ